MWIYHVLLTPMGGVVGGRGRWEVREGQEEKREGALWLICKINEKNLIRKNVPQNFTVVFT